MRVVFSAIIYFLEPVYFLQKQSGESVAGDSSSTDKKSSSEKKEATSTLQGAISVQGSNNEAGKNEKQNNRSQSTGLSSSTSSKSALKNASSKPFRPATASVSEDYKDGSNSSNSNDGNNEKEAKKQSVGYSLPPILSSPNNASSSGTGYVYKAGSIDSAMQHAPPPSTVRVCMDLASCYTKRFSSLYLPSSRYTTPSLFNFACPSPNALLLLLLPQSPSILPRTFLVHSPTTATAANAPAEACGAGTATAKRAPETRPGPAPPWAMGPVPISCPKCASTLW